MKNKLFVVIFSIIIAVSLSSIILTQSKKDNTENIEITEENSNYFLKDYNGKIAIFKGNSEIPYEIYNVFTSSLPETDVLKIKNGIEANNENELKELISDYLSWKPSFNYGLLLTTASATARSNGVVIFML